MKRMFRLTREVRFAINHTLDDQERHAPTNSYAGYPSLTGLGYHLTLRATLAGQLETHSSYLANIKDIDRALRESAIPRLADTIRKAPESFGARDFATFALEMKDA